MKAVFSMYCTVYRLLQSAGHYIHCPENNLNLQHKKPVTVGEVAMMVYTVPVCFASVPYSKYAQLCIQARHIPLHRSAVTNSVLCRNADLIWDSVQLLALVSMLCFDFFYKCFQMTYLLCVKYKHHECSKFTVFYCTVYIIPSVFKWQNYK